MIEAIQRAYYLDARNPSDTATLIELAAGIGLDPQIFADEIASDAVEQELQRQVTFARQAPINGFPSLILQTASGVFPIAIHYGDPAPMRAQIEGILFSTGSASPR